MRLGPSNLQDVITLNKTFDVHRQSPMSLKISMAFPVWNGVIPAMKLLRQTHGVEQFSLLWSALVFFTERFNKIPWKSAVK